MWTPQRIRRAVARQAVSIPFAVAILVVTLVATACPAPLLASESDQRAEVWDRLAMPYGDNLASGDSTFAGWWRLQVRDAYAMTSRDVAGYWNSTRTLGSRPDPFRLDFSTDWCGPFGVATVGPGWDFHAACLRHDFGYRNLKMLDRRWNCSAWARNHRGHCRRNSGLLGRNWNAANRKQVDTVFIVDMFRHCNIQPSRNRRICRGAANTMHALVRLGG